jgi:hypothetical protein
MAQFINVEYPNIHFVYVFYDGNVRAPSRITSISIHIGSNTTDVFLVVYCSLQETHSFMPPAHMGHGTPDVEKRKC